ncbi:UNVERIFIED_CONTAM: Copia protein [Sesamum radiatum]|uniref:Copia protein n=1 Tax=Sesamum radiatum TaxID=300843 RepID=A0AAW2R1Q7_SESRA
MFQKKDFPSDSQHDETLLEESSEISHETSETASAPIVPTDSVLVLFKTAKVTKPLERYGFVGLTSQLNNDPKTYGETMLDIDSDKWLEAMKFEMNSMGSNQVWTLVDLPKGVKPVGCKRNLGADGEVTTFKARLVAKGYTQRSGVDFEEPTHMWQWLSPFGYCLSLQHGMTMKYGRWT